METVTSRIKSMFSQELLRYIAAICDTSRIDSNNERMVVLCDLLYTHGIDFEILGGATNRIALQIDGYAIKFAMDKQGYLDNLIEYSLSPELQPYVTKSYETNGYIQVQELVEVMTKEKFKVYRVEIYKILDALCQDYLLGDVGYIDKNRTNWGIRGGRPVILDYAYCHRATENLFTCSKCGAPLKYDSTYDKLMCSDRSGCKAIYTYNERKRIQGRQVDEDMVKERKAESIRLTGENISKEIEMFEDRLLGDNYFVIDTPADMHRYNQLIKEASGMKVSINGRDKDDYALYEEEYNMYSLEEKFSAMVDLAMNPNDANAKAIIDASADDDEYEIPEPIYTENYQERYLMAERPGYYVRSYGFHDDDDDDYREEYDEDENSCADLDVDDIFSSMIDTLKADEEEPRYAEYYHYPDNVEPGDEETESEQKPIIMVNGHDSDEENLRNIHRTLLSQEETEAIAQAIREINESMNTVDNNVDEPAEQVVEEVIEEPVQQVSPEDAAVLVNGVPLPVGEEVII